MKRTTLARKKEIVTGHTPEPMQSVACYDKQHHVCSGLCDPYFSKKKCSCWCHRPPKKLERPELPTGKGKKTAHCTPEEILGRVDQVISNTEATIYRLKHEAFDEIAEILREWKYS